MNKIFSFCLLVLFLSGTASLFSQPPAASEPEERTIRFRSGLVMAAELLPDTAGCPTKIININKFEPPSRITSDVAYAALTVKLDTGRSLSIYDYSLVTKRGDEYKCIAIREGDGDFDADKWEYVNTSTDKLYTLLFKVQIPGFGQADDYILRFNLTAKEKKRGLVIPFMRIEHEFTLASKIPNDGMLGKDPEKKIKKEVPPPPPEVVPVAAPATAPAATPAAAVAPAAGTPAATTPVAPAAVVPAAATAPATVPAATPAGTAPPATPVVTPAATPAAVTPVVPAVVAPAVGTAPVAIPANPPAATDPKKDTAPPAQPPANPPAATK